MATNGLGKANFGVVRSRDLAQIVALNLCSLLVVIQLLSLAITFNQKCTFAQRIFTSDLLSLALSAELVTNTSTIQLYVGGSTP